MAAKKRLVQASSSVKLIEAKIKSMNCEELKKVNLYVVRLQAKILKSIIAAGVGTLTLTLCLGEWLEHTPDCLIDNIRLIF